MSYYYKRKRPCRSPYGCPRYRRKRRYKRRRYYRSRYPVGLKQRVGTRGTQVLNNRRKNVGLPPFQVHKRKIRHELTNYVNYNFGLAWSLYYNLDAIPYGVEQDQREAPIVNILPQKLFFTIQNQDPETNTLYTYRILIVKVFKQNNSQYFNATLLPGSILQDTSTVQLALQSNYVEKEPKKDRDTRFKVIYDKLIRHDVTVMNNILDFTIKLPSRNVEYDRDDETGLSKNNSLLLFLLTDAPYANDYYRSTFSTQSYYIDY